MRDHGDGYGKPCAWCVSVLALFEVIEAVVDDAPSVDVRWQLRDGLRLEVMREVVERVARECAGQWRLELLDGGKRVPAR